MIACTVPVQKRTSTEPALNPYDKYRIGLGDISYTPYCTPGEIRTPVTGFGDRYPSHWTTDVYGTCISITTHSKCGPDTHLTFALPAGLEPATHCLTGNRSNLLSYGNVEQPRLKRD